MAKVVIQNTVTALKIEQDGEKASLTITAPESPTLTLTSQGTQGPPGPDGKNLTVTAQEEIAMHRAVTIDGKVCSPEAKNLNAYAGIALGGAQVGDLVTLQKFGALDVNPKTLTPNQNVLIGENGTLVQTDQEAPRRAIGYAATATLINLDPQPTIGV